MVDKQYSNGCSLILNSERFVGSKLMCESPCKFLLSRIIFSEHAHVESMRKIAIGLFTCKDVCVRGFS